MILTETSIRLLFARFPKGYKRKKVCDIIQYHVFSCLYWVNLQK